MPLSPSLDQSAVESALLSLWCEDISLHQFALQLGMSWRGALHLAMHGWYKLNHKSKGWRMFGHADYPDNKAARWLNEAWIRRNGLEKHYP